MARIRSVHPNLFTDEAWVSCSPVARLLFIGLWTDADDSGVFEWKPLQLKMRLLPGDGVDAGALLEELRSVGLVRGFDHEGKSYGGIKDFQKWQRPKKPRAVYHVPAELVPYLTGVREAEADLFGGPVGNQSRTGGEKVNQMESEDGGGNRRVESDARPRRKPETPLPEGFPDEQAMADAQAKCDAALADVDLAREAERFRGFHLSKDNRYRDWRAAWLNTWLGNTIRDAPKRAPNVVAFDDAAHTRRKHRAWMEDWMLKGEPGWDRGRRGPTPAEPGCAIPAEVMAEFHFTPPLGRQA